MGVSVVLGEANHSLCSGSPSEHFQLGSLGKEAQAFQHLHQEPGQPFLAELSLESVFRESQIHPLEPMSL